MWSPLSLRLQSARTVSPKQKVLSLSVEGPSQPLWDQVSPFLVHFSVTATLILRYLFPSKIDWGSQRVYSFQDRAFMMAFSLSCFLGRTLVPALGADLLIVLFGCAGSLLQSAGFLDLRRVGSTLELQCAGLSLWGLLLGSTGLVALQWVESSRTRD